MFGILDDIAKNVTNTTREFVEDPIGKSIDIATQPIRDGADIIDGLTEGELRYKAGLRLGADIVSGMALSELIEWYSGE